MPRAGLDAAGLVTAGADLADEIGFGNLTMGLLAERVGVRTPSLYKHVDSLDALRHAIANQARREFAEVLARAAVGKSGPEAVRAFADRYRRWALDHPGRYAATVRAPEAGDAEGHQVSGDALQLMYDVLAGFELSGTRAIDAARVLRSSLHGFATLESAGGFGLPQDVTRSYHFLVDTLIAGLAHSAPDDVA
ncbi:TetR/AcrR family transcriptional regulator [Paractinoplanes ferrugineus]|uniref:TetR family transcriptional regulator n=1 Tax=Paractinoplanes ferrugineus TaxID=113564 RepID=A0A919MDR7_9ACTN|nr:TetR/AcrR family transcriptional regulator [Actinoplanes ferrugineus]GIE16081.1 TetR family transcriptional regulator [Actinoplanes ferrugineus]